MSLKQIWFKYKTNRLQKCVFNVWNSKESICVLYPLNWSCTVDKIVKILFPDNLIIKIISFDVGIKYYRSSIKRLYKVCIGYKWNKITFIHPLFRFAHAYFIWQYICRCNCKISSFLYLQYREISYLKLYVKHTYCYYFCIVMLRQELKMNNCQRWHKIPSSQYIDDGYI